jgi:hypothetical protein
LTNPQAYAIILVESEGNKMEYNLHYINCPICGMQLVELFGEGSEYNYHCDQCHIDITIDTGEEDEEGE